MRNSFVGLIGRCENLELQSLLPERQATRQWLLSSAQQRHALGIWAVMDCGVAAEISELLNAGEGEAALRRMMGGADWMGPLSHDEDFAWQRSAK